MSTAYGCSHGDNKLPKEEDPFNAAYFGEFESLKLLVKEKPDLIKATDVMGGTLLHNASHGNQTDIIRYLVERGADVNAQDKSKETPLHYAARSGNSFDAAKLLIELGADVNARPEAPLPVPIKRPDGTMITKDYGISVLDQAATSGDYRLVELLIEKGTKVEEESPGYKNALHYACFGTRHSKNPKYPENVGNRKVIAILTKHIDINCKSRGLEQTPLYYAAGFGSVETVKYLVSTYDKIDLNASDSDGDTPLHLAVKGFGGSIKNRAAVIKVLIEAGADVTRVNSKRMTPRQLAEKFGHKTIIDAFNNQ